MASYIETYSINDTRCGIEDYEAPGQHFMPDRPHLRFKCWVGGAGICKGHSTLALARRHLANHMGNRLREQHTDTMQKAGRIGRAEHKLHLRGLAGFKEVEDNDDGSQVDAGSHPQPTP